MADRLLTKSEEPNINLDKVFYSLKEISSSVAIFVNNDGDDFDEVDIENILMELNTLSFDMGFSFYLKEMGMYRGDLYYDEKNLRIAIDDLAQFNEILSCLQCKMADAKPAVLEDLREFIVVLFNSQFGPLKEYALIEDGEVEFEPNGSVPYDLNFVEFWKKIPLDWLKKMNFSEAFIKDVEFLKAILNAPFSKEEIEEILYYYGWLMVSLNLDLSLMQQGHSDLTFTHVAGKNIDRFMEHLNFVQNNPGISVLRREFSARLMSVLEDFDLALIYVASNEAQAKWLLDFSKKLREKYEHLSYFN
jgi:hypothetical protein